MPCKVSRHSLIGGGLPTPRLLLRRQSPITSSDAVFVRSAPLIRGGPNAIRGGVLASNGLSIQLGW
jgi:hypothetical protein